MKLHTRFLALLLAGMMALSLAACTGGENADDTPTSPSGNSDDTETTTDSILPDDFVVDTAVADLCLATADIPGDFELFTINGDPVTARAYLYWMSYNIYYLTQVYGATFDWEPTEDGFSLPDYLKEETKRAAAYYSLVASKAKELGFDLTEEQVNELEGNLALTIMMAGEEEFEDELRKEGLDYDTFYALNTAPYYYKQLLDGLYAGRPTADEMAAYIEENDILYAKHILLATVDLSTREPLDEDTIADKKATAERLLAQLQSSTDLAADFDALMNEYSEDSGLASNPDGYTFTANQMVSEFEAATRELEFDQISGLVESEFGYHIILRLDPADLEDLQEECRNDLLDTQMEAWFKEAEIVLTDEYDALDPHMFYEKYMAYREAFAAEAEAAAAEDEAASPEDDA